jgi:F-box-like
MSDLIPRTYNVFFLPTESISINRRNIGGRIRRITISTLPDELLLEIFDYCRLDNKSLWNIQRRWYIPLHVCRRWRYVILASASRLDLRLLCTHGTPVADMLFHSPPLPLIINYTITVQIPPEDKECVLLALQHRDRVRSINFNVLGSGPSELLMSMGEDFPMLEDLEFSSQDGTSPVLPLNFAAPHLRRLDLRGVVFQRGSLLLSSATSLVSLHLEHVPPSAYFPPEYLVAHVSSIPQLEELSIGFVSSTPRPDVEMELRRMQITRVVFPSILKLVFRGVSAYLESLLARISCPSLKIIKTTLFHQLTFSLPRLAQFISVAENPSFRTALVKFSEKSTIIKVHRPQESPIAESSFQFSAICKQFDWQTASVAQICRALAPALATVYNLDLQFYTRKLPEEWHDVVDQSHWRALLRTFCMVRSLSVDGALVGELSRALQPNDSEVVEELLPGLSSLTLRNGEHDVGKALTSFVNARRLAGRPIRLYTETDALSYLDTVKVQFHDKLDVYNHFLHIMKDFKTSFPPVFILPAFLLSLVFGSRGVRSWNLFDRLWCYFVALSFSFVGN